MHGNLNLNHAEADKPTVSSRHMLQSLAEKALKHIPGSANVIEQHFSSKPIVPGIKNPKPINLIMHMPH